MKLRELLIALVFLQSVREDMSFSRRRRYVVFPESSTFSVAVCAQLRALTEDLRIFTFSMNWAVSYELPNETLRDSMTRRPYLRRRHRRELYRKLEIAMDSADLDGPVCILRTLCEAAQRLIPRTNIAQELLRTVFSLPYEEDDQEDEVTEYDAAYRNGISGKNCLQFYPTCYISLLDMLLGGMVDA